MPVPLCAGALQGEDLQWYRSRSVGKLQEKPSLCSYSSAQKGIKERSAA